MNANAMVEPGLRVSRRRVCGVIGDELAPHPPKGLG
jgi:hypothetical protein